MAWTRRQVYVLGTGASAVGRGVEMVSGLLTVWFATRMLAVEGYGDFVLALTVVEVLSLLASGGLEGLVVYRTSRAEAPPGELDGAEVAGAAFGWSLLLGCGAGAALWAAAPVLGGLFDKPDSAYWLRALAPVVPIAVARHVYAAWHRGRQRIPHYVFFGNALPRLATALALGVAFALSPTPWAIAAAFVLAPLAVWLPWFARDPLRPAGLARALGAWDARYAARLSLNALLQRGVTHGDILLLGLLSTSAVTAQYAVASRIALLALTVFTLFIPTFASRVGYLLSRGQRDDLKDEYDQTRALGLLGAMVSASAIGLVGLEVLGLFGDFQAGMPVLLILTAGWLGQTSFGMNRSYLSVAGYSGWTLAVTSLLVLANLGLDLLFIPLWGGEGAAVATFVSLVGVRALTSVAVWKLDRFPTWSVGLALLTGASLALLLAAAAGRLAPPLAGLALLPLSILVVWPHRRRWSAQLSRLWSDARTRA